MSARNPLPPGEYKATMDGDGMPVVLGRGGRLISISFKLRVIDGAHEGQTIRANFAIEGTDPASRAIVARELPMLADFAESLGAKPARSRDPIDLLFPIWSAAKDQTIDVTVGRKSSSETRVTKIVRAS